MTVAAGATLRANPRYELVPLDHLARSERELVETDDAIYGALRPRAGADLKLRAVGPDTALLFITLREPARLPTYFRARLGGDADREIVRLVLDGVLEIEHLGEFVCGAGARGVVAAGRSAGGSGRIGELSLAAVDYGRALSGCGV